MRQVVHETPPTNHLDTNRAEDTEFDTRKNRYHTGAAMAAPVGVQSSKRQL